MTRSHIHLRAKAGRHGELLGVLDRLEVLTAARQQPGFLAAEVQVAFDDEDDVLVWSSWSSHEHYERWLASPLGEAMFHEVGDLLAQELELRVYHVVDAVQ